MLPSVSAFVTFALATTAVAAPQGPKSFGHDGAWPNSQDWLEQNLPGKYNLQECTPDTQAVRYDFDAMAPADRKAYTDAVNCMYNQPSQLDPAQYPGAINRYMHYATIHGNRTLNVHLDGFFLTWHRMFIWLWEQDLRKTCGYQGTQPYWNWPATVGDLHGSNIFNGDEYSMSSDGYPKDQCTLIHLSPDPKGLALPHGTGGGCIMSGPFTGWNRSMNSLDISILTSGGPLPPTAFDKNITCLTRDLNPLVAQAYINSTQVATALASPDMATFDFLVNGSPIKQVLGIHSSAHFTMGDPASNVFVSAQDPIWFPLHTMLDHVYVQWQTLHPDVALTFTGTQTAVNVPPSPNVTLQTYEPDWGYLHPSLMVGELVNTTAGPFCYRYA